MWKVIKYATLTVLGALLFITVNQAANAERAVASIGGEAFFLILPFVWWVTERTVKELLAEYKQMWLEIKLKRGDKPQEHKTNNNGGNKNG